jgi:hypothetical protein
MKRFFRIFDLSKNEQRVVLIVMLVLIAVAFVGYQRRLHRDHVRAPGGIRGEKIAQPCSNGD